ncbi:hypothetical protein HPB50_002206 [Hyalomma asiaticum]|uniref:Uncharacterized protein n=1 Tax=Hyalomma asiaticum TaxID=266040 RepID=A0ACB7RRE3_HYAAI|nr:hypothetical protein HPB50_002206 [Hyalomma asiaticum]
MGDPVRSLRSSPKWDATELLAIDDIQGMTAFSKQSWGDGKEHLWTLELLKSVFHRPFQFMGWKILPCLMVAKWVLISSADVNRGQLWLAHIEATYDLHNISEISRFRRLLWNLSPEVAQEVANIIAAPLNDAPCQCLKQSIYDYTITSESARLKHLLITEELGDRRASQLPNSMRQLLWSSDSTRLVLAAAGELTLDRVAQLADRVHDATSASATALSSTSESSVVSHMESRTDRSPLPSTLFGHPLMTSVMFPHVKATDHLPRVVLAHAVLEVHLFYGIIALTSTAPFGAEACSIYSMRAIGNASFNFLAPCG